MATLKEIIYHIKNLKASGVQSDDTSVSDEQYMFMIDQYRARLIRLKYDKFSPINPNDIQDLGYVSVIPSPVDEMPQVGGFDIFETSRKLPRMVTTDRGSLYTFVGYSPVDIPFQRTSLTKLPWDRHSKYTKALTKWFEVNNKIYISTQQPIVELFAMGIAESPFEVIKFKGEVNYADPYSFEYPLSISMLDTMYKMMAEAEFKILGLSQEDRINDGHEEKPKVSQ
jgi:hypothetical protein